MIERILKVEDEIVDPNNVRSRWRAMIFADKQTARVTGRIAFLIISIHSINGIKIFGVSC